MSSGMLQRRETWKKWVALRFANWNICLKPLKIIEQLLFMIYAFIPHLVPCFIIICISQRDSRCGIMLCNENDAWNQDWKGFSIYERLLNWVTISLSHDCRDPDLYRTGPLYFFPVFDYFFSSTFRSNDENFFDCRSCRWRYSRINNMKSESLEASFWSVLWCFSFNWFKRRKKLI